MIGKALMAAIQSAAKKLGGEESVLIQQYLEYSPDERIGASVWVNLFEIADETGYLERFDQTGSIRAGLREGKLPSFSDWWGRSPVVKSEAAQQLELPLGMD